MTHIDFKDAQEAYRVLKARGKIPSGWPESRTLDQFFGMPSSDIYGRLVENTTQAMLTGPDCPAPVLMGTDCWTCPRCGIAWDRDEEKPPCHHERK